MSERLAMTYTALLTSVAAVLSFDAAFAAELYFEPDAITEDFAAINDDALKFADGLTRLTIVNAKAVSLDREIARQLEEALAKGPGRLDESLDLPFFAGSCRLSRLIETQVGAEHLGGWWGHGSCARTGADVYIGSNLDNDYFRITYYPAGRLVYGLELVKGTDFAVVYEVGPPPPPSHDIPKGVVLLPGYEHVPGRGIDSLVGAIVKEGDLVIRYDIGPPAGNYATGRSDERRWLQSLERGGRTIDIAMRRDRTLVVTISRTAAAGGGGREGLYPANFYAVVRNQEDIAEVLLMVLGYSGQ